MPDQARDARGRYARSSEAAAAAHAELVAALTQRRKPIPPGAGMPKARLPEGRMDPIRPPVGRYEPWELRLWQLRHGQ